MPCPRADQTLGCKAVQLALAQTTPALTSFLGHRRLLFPVRRLDTLGRGHRWGNYVARTTLRKVDLILYSASRARVCLCVRVFVPACVCVCCLGSSSNPRPTYCHSGLETFLSQYRNLIFVSMYGPHSSGAPLACGVCRSSSPDLAHAL